MSFIMSYVVSLSRRDFIYPRFREQILYKNRSKKFIAYFLVLLIILFSVLCIVRANSVATGGYRIQEYQNELTGLRSENKNFELKLSEVQSPGFLEERIKDLNMVKIEKVEYLTIISEVAAK